MSQGSNPVQFELDALQKLEAVHIIEEGFRQGRINDPEVLVICGRILQRVGHRLQVNRINRTAA